MLLDSNQCANARIRTQTDPIADKKANDNVFHFSYALAGLHLATVFGTVCAWRGRERGGKGGREGGREGGGGHLPTPLRRNTCTPPLVSPVHAQTGGSVLRHRDWTLNPKP